MRLITDGGVYVQVMTENGTLLTFRAESGWHAWSGEFRWRLAPLCYRCDEPITGPPVCILNDIPASRSWCSEDCLDESAEISASHRVST